MSLSPPVVAMFALCLLAPDPGAADEPAERALRSLRADPSAKVRAQAAFALARVGAHGSVPALEKALAEDEAVPVRVAAATALGRLAAVSSMGHLRDAAAHDPDPAVRESARRALGRILRGARTLAIEPVEGGRVDAAMRERLRSSLAAELERHGFAVAGPGDLAGYRLKPTVLLVDEGKDASGLHVEVKTSLIALDVRGEVAAMVEGGARAESRVPAPPEELAGQALDAAARSLSEDLAHRLPSR